MNKVNLCEGNTNIMSMKKEEENKRTLVFVGDVHGKFCELIWKATVEHKLQDADLFVLGDFGVGFDGSLKRDYQRMRSKMENHGIEVWIMRGNHDDPSWFEEETPENKESRDLIRETYPRLHFLPDHKIITLSGTSIYPIGGGGSTDIAYREPGKNWWEGEYIKELPLKDLPGKVDIIVSHEAPLTFEPILARMDDTPEDQYIKIRAGREFLDTVLKEVTTKRWFYGHYHKSYSGSYGNVLYRGLAELELYGYYNN